MGIMRNFRKLAVQMHAQSPCMTLLDFSAELIENRFDPPRRNVGTYRTGKYCVGHFSVFMVHRVQSLANHQPEESSTTAIPTGLMEILCAVPFGALTSINENDGCREHLWQESRDDDGKLRVSPHSLTNINMLPRLTGNL
jgi:hypothetical protein